MIYAKYIVLLLASLCVDLLGLVMVALALCFRDPEGRLPWWAWPWNNDREPFGDEARGAAISVATGFLRSFLLWHWLAIRNPGNNFGYLIGFEQSPDVTYTYEGDPDTGDQSRPGTLFVEASAVVERWLHWEHRRTAFCYYHVSKPYWLFGRRCLRVFVGWKIHDMVKDGKKAQLVFVVNPFMGYEGA